jgi:hypothetical protein
MLSRDQEQEFFSDGTSLPFRFFRKREFLDGMRIIIIAKIICACHGVNADCQFTAYEPFV